MKNGLIAIIIILILGLAAAGGWYFLIKKSTEGGRCSNDSRCETGLKCLNQKCSSGQKGSSCTQKSDCQTGYCVSNLCTEGKAGNNCKTYGDCEKGLMCKKSLCATPPDYSKYFSNIIISKIKPGSGPGPNNPETVTNTFTRADAIEMDFVGVKSTTVGDFYYEIVNSITGEVLRSSQNEQQLTFSGQDRGTGTSLDNVSPGEYDLNIYFNNELVYTTQITVSQ